MPGLLPAERVHTTVMLQPLQGYKRCVTGPVWNIHQAADTAQEERHNPDCNVLMKLKKWQLYSPITDNKDTGKGTWFSHMPGIHFISARDLFAEVHVTHSSHDFVRSMESNISRLLG